MTSGARSIFADIRFKQFLIGGCAVLFVSAVIAFCWYMTGAEGFVGELFRFFVGVFSSPIFLESALVILGFVIVLVINAIVRKRQGEEYVYLEQVEGPEGEVLPEEARSVIYTEKPASWVEPTALELAEGAIDAADYHSAWHHLNKLTKGEFNAEAGLALRLRLAIGTGKLRSARGVAKRLRQLNAEHPVLVQWAEAGGK